MTILGYIIKEFGRILLKKGYKEHSALLRGVKLYRTVSCKGGVKSRWKCLGEIIYLFRHWNAFPDTYFRFGMFMKNYTDMERMKSFVPQGAYYRYSIDKDSRYHLLIDDKIIFHDLMANYGLPVPTRYFIFRCGHFRNGAKLLSDSDVDAVIQNINDERIFLKRHTGGAASGVSIFTKKSKGIYVDSDGDILNAAMIRKKYDGIDLIFEQQLIQEHDLSQFNPDTVNTIRVLTYKDKVISAAVRFGGKGSFVDNTAKGGIGVSLDIQNGKLQSYGMREFDLTQYTEHPDSHLKFENTIVTQWPLAKALVEKAVKYIPYYNSVGFDIATTNEGPIIIEINTGSGIFLSQMGKDYGLADYFSE